MAHLRDVHPTRLAQLTEAGLFPYDDCFRGHVLPDAEASTEDTAIYLLQETHAAREFAARIAALLADGYTDVDRDALHEGLNSVAAVALVDHRYGLTGEIVEVAKARLLVQKSAITGIRPPALAHPWPSRRYRSPSAGQALTTGTGSSPHATSPPQPGPRVPPWNTGP